VASRLLANARSIRDELALDSADTNRKLSEAVLAVITYTEKVENTTRLLALADSCVGQIRARMRAHGVPIHPPSVPANPVTPTRTPDINGEVNQGSSLHSQRLDDRVLMRF
jgi:hypothetical protein